MADTIDKLKELAKEIRYASATGENTAEKVGRVLVGILDTEDSEMFSLKQDKSGEMYLYTDYPIATRHGLINYADNGTIDLPSLYDGLPIDNVTIGRDADGALCVLGGVGSDFDSMRMWEVLGASTNEQINKSHLTTVLSDYATESWTTDKLTGYVTTSRLNELIGGASGAFDTLKEIEDYINEHGTVTAGIVASLGEKVDKVSGYGLSKNDFTDLLKTKLDGIAEGANKYILPIARAAVLGGVMIGSNINVDAQGLISTHAPYELTKDKVLSVLKDADGIIKLDAHLALSGGLINYATMPGIDLPGIYDGLPIDGTTIGRDAQGRLTVIGGVGMSSVTVKLGSMAYESVDGVVSLPAYPTSLPASDVYAWAKAATKPSYSYIEITGTPPAVDLSGYVTTNTTQDVIGYKTFRNASFNKIASQTSPTEQPVVINGINNGSSNGYLPAIGFHIPGVNYASIGFQRNGFFALLNHAMDGYVGVIADSFVKANGIPEQLLRADGGVSTWYWSGQSGQPTWVWGGNGQHSYYVYNPSNFNVYSSVRLRVEDIRNTTPLPNAKSNASVSSWFNLTGTPDGDWWGGICVAAWNDVNYERWELAGPATSTNTQRSLHYRSGQGSTWGSWKTILDSSNWTSIIDGRYLPLTGGTVTGSLLINPTTGNYSEGIRISNHSSGWSNMHFGCTVNTTSGLNPDGNQWLVGKNPSGEFLICPNDSMSNIGLSMRKNSGRTGITWYGQEIWHSGNDGAGSGLDADYLGGVNYSNFPRYDGWITNPGWNMNERGNAIRFTYSNNGPTYGGALSISAGGYGFQLLSQYTSDAEPLWFRTFGTDSDGGIRAWRKLLHDGCNGATINGNIDLLAPAGQSRSLQFTMADNDFARIQAGGASNDGYLEIATADDGTEPIYVRQYVGPFTNIARSLTLLDANGNTTIPGQLYAVNGLHKWVDQDYKIRDKRALVGATEGLYINYGNDFPIVNVSSSMYLSGYVHSASDIRATGALYSDTRIFTGYDAQRGSGISCSGWFASSGSTGWINDTYGGGLYMVDNTWVRIYGNKNFYVDSSSADAIHTAGGVNASGRGHFGGQIDADGGFSIRYDAGSWISMGQRTNCIHSNQWNSASSAHALYNVRDVNGNAVAFGGLGGEIGFYGFPKAYLDNGTNSYSWKTVWDVSTGNITHYGNLILNGGGLVTYSSDMRLKNIEELFVPTIQQLADLPVFTHTWNNGVSGIQLSTSAQAVRRIMPWNVFEGEDGYLKMDGTRTALAVSIRLAQLANEYIIKNDSWKDTKDRQIEELQREIEKLKQRLNAA